MQLYFSSNLQYLRETRRVTMEEVAEALTPKAARQTISNWESGRSPPSIEYAVQIVLFFGVSPGRMLSVDMRIAGTVENENNNVEVITHQIPANFDTMVQNRFKKCVEDFMIQKGIYSREALALHLNAFASDSKVSHHQFSNVFINRNNPSQTMIGLLKAAWPAWNINYIFDESLKVATEEQSGGNQEILRLSRAIYAKLEATE